MKNAAKWPKTPALFFATILLQSCVVYDIKQPVTLEQAALEQKKVKIKTKTNQTFKYRNISFEDGLYYGVKRKSGEFTRVQLNDNEIIQVLVQNKSGSDWATVAVIAAPIIILLVLALTIDPTLKIDSPIGMAAN